MSPTHLTLPTALLANLPMQVLDVTPTTVSVVLASGQQLDLVNLVRSLAWRARDKDYPRKSIGAALRERTRRGDLRATREEADVIAEVAVDWLLASGAGRSLQDEWGTIADAARALSVSVERIRTMLESDAGRRSLGWPVRVDEMEWRIPMVALRSETRTQYIAALPAEDPYVACDSGESR
jgi:phage gp46-like protein